MQGNRQRRIATKRATAISSVRGAAALAVAIALAGAPACEGTHRESWYPAPDELSELEGERAGMAGSAGMLGSPPIDTSSTGPAETVTNVGPLRPSDSADTEDLAGTALPAPDCAEGSTESCGPPREDGICRFGTRTCRGGAWSECAGAVFPSSRDCSSTDDNDCDGQPDDTIDDVCRCPVGGEQACEEHPGLDGKGPCRAGQQACVPGPSNLTSDWGPCTGSVPPGDQDSCSIAGDDADCDGAPNGGCACIEGSTVPCGPDTDLGICQRGISTCRNGAFSACEGAVFPGRRDCSSAQDNDCNGQPDDTLDATCTCIIGDVQACGTHPDRDGNGPCRAGSQRCEAGAQNVTSRFSACIGSVGPAQRDSCTVLGDDADCSGTANSGCQCIAGQGNGPCRGDANNSRCNAQGACAPCQSNADCSLVAGGLSLCNAGRCVAPRCGDGITSAGEQCDDGNMVDTDGCTNACQMGSTVPVVTVQRFAWTSRQAAVAMGPTQGRACFLTRVGGAFNAAGDSVQIVAQGGQWVLTGTAASGFVEARAACMVAQGVTTEVAWQQGQDPVPLQDSQTHACFYTRIAGNFQGGGENVELRRVDGPWTVGGASAIAVGGLSATARCMLMTPLPVSYSMLFADPSPLPMDPILNGACFLSRISGDLGAEGDFVETEWAGSNWELRRGREPGGTRPLAVRGLCIGRNDGRGVPVL